MQNYIGIFKRVEKKFVINQEQYDFMRKMLGSHIVSDEHGESVISNIYYDTDTFELIRRSLTKPVYKEKLRLRGYGTVTGESDVFVEIKKKFKGVVYKRRILLPYDEATSYLSKGEKLEKPSQISREIDWFKQYYKGLSPKMVISYRRKAFYDSTDPNLRITFDSDILWRNYDLDLRKGVYGNRLTQPGTYVMEIKFANAMPLWLCGILSQGHIYKTSYSKYGNAFLEMEKKHNKEEETKIININGGIDCA